MNTVLVTAYIPIAGHPRGPAEYGELGEKIGILPVRKKCFYQQLDTCWMTKFVRGLPFTPTPSEGDNPDKNSLAYHIVNHQKSTWLKEAADENPDADVVCWVDYGIFSQPYMNGSAIIDFFNRLDDSYIYAPGCWDKPAVIESAYPCWRFCGSVLSVPTKLVHEFDFECRAKARQHVLATRKVEWEVNTWSRVEQGKRKFPWKWYKADHDVSQFKNAPLPSR